MSFTTMLHPRERKYRQSHWPMRPAPPTTRTRWLIGTGGSTPACRRTLSSIRRRARPAPSDELIPRLATSAERRVCTCSSALSSRRGRPRRFRDGRGRLDGDAERNRHAARDAAEDPAGVIRLRHDSAGRDRERIVVLAPAHRRRAEAGAEIDAFHGGYREEEIGERRLD